MAAVRKLGFTNTTACRAINGIETACCICDVDRIRSGRRRNGAVSRRKHTIAVSSCGALVFCSGIAFTKVRNVYRLCFHIYCGAGGGIVDSQK
jgi:hypothetical protein